MGPSISLDALVCALLCAAYLPMRFIIPMPPIIPGSLPATISLIAAMMGYFMPDLIDARSEFAERGAPQQQHHEDVDDQQWKIEACEIKTEAGCAPRF